MQKVRPTRAVQSLCTTDHLCLHVSVFVQMLSYRYNPDLHTPPIPLCIFQYGFPLKPFLIVSCRWFSIYVDINQAVGVVLPRNASTFLLVC